mgnify:CR=1 FL=1
MPPKKATKVLKKKVVVSESGSNSDTEYDSDDFKVRKESPHVSEEEDEDVSEEEDEDVSEEEDEDVSEEEDEEKSNYSIKSKSPLPSPKRVAKPKVIANDDEWESDFSSDSEHRKEKLAIKNIKVNKPKVVEEDDWDSEEDEEAEEIKGSKNKIVKDSVTNKDDDKIKFSDNSNLLTDDNDKIMQPSSIKTQLMNHQRSIIKKMIDVERNGELILDKVGISNAEKMKKDSDNDRRRWWGRDQGFFSHVNNPDEIKIKTDFAILGDMVGAGKTLDIVTLLTINNKIKENEFRANGNEHYTVTVSKKKGTENKKLNTNIIVVPSKILFQWKKAFEDNSKLKVYSIGTEKEIDNLLIKKYEDIELKIVEIYKEFDVGHNRYYGYRNNRNNQEEKKVYRYFDEYERKKGGTTWSKKVNGKPQIGYYGGPTRTNVSNYTKYNKLLKAVKFKETNDTDKSREIIVSSQKLIDTKLNVNKIKNLDVLLIKDTMFKRILVYMEDYAWKRFIVDEADTIQYSPGLEQSIKSTFKWFITGTPSGLQASKPFFKSYFGERFKYEFLTLKNLNSYVKNSIILPPPKRFIIKCLTPREINIIKNFVSPGIMQMINAGNTDEAIKALNCNVDTEENIFIVLTRQISEKLDNYRIEYESESRKHYQNKAEKETKLKRINGYIKKTEEKLKDINDKIKGLSDECCPVCLGDYEDGNKTILKCCNAMYCFECITSMLGEKRQATCPQCDQNILQQDMIVINNNADKPKQKKKIKKDEVKEKMEALKDIIMNKKDGSFLIFANFENTFSKIETELKQINVPYYILKGQGSVVQKYITDFKEKRVNVLMLNAKFFGAGMNLQMTTDIIMFHRFTYEMEEQIVGRAQRLGRDIKSILSVYYLVHDNEKQTFENNFSFKDQFVGINDLVEDIKNKKTDKTLLLENESDEETEEESEEESDEETEEESEEESDEETEEELDNEEDELENVIDNITKLDQNNKKQIKKKNTIKDVVIGEDSDNDEECESINME